ncbi:cytochrome P450 family 82 subfamily C polypeptide 4 [Euphorbia peplus]|nr:cytochrome P450 family 82 subfamily C polypeptide 4 [Euphorbia peplus]
MDTLHVLQWFLTLIFTLLGLIFLFHRSKRAPTRLRLPQAGRAWPVIGHMHLFGSNQLIHKTLSSMEDKYGPVFTIKIGSHRVLTVNDSDTARECFTTHDRTFSDRPAITASKLLGYNLAMFGFAPYGPYWREMRKIATVELLSAHRIDMLKHIRAQEVQVGIKQLYKTWIDEGSRESGVMVEMKQWFGDLTSNVALRMVGGKRCFGADSDMGEGEARRCKEVMREWGSLFGVFVLSDSIPFLAWFDFNGYEKRMKKTAKELDILIEGWLKEHKERRLMNGEEKKEQDFMDVMLSILEDAKVSGFDADTINKSTCLNMILAASDTTMVTLTWALSLLLNNEQELKKAKEELEIHVGKDRNVDESDLKNLVYLQAIVKETLRLCPPVSVIGLHSSLEDCTLTSGYHVPAGTRLMTSSEDVDMSESPGLTNHKATPLQVMLVPRLNSRLY